METTAPVPAQGRGLDESEAAGHENTAGRETQRHSEPLSIKTTKDTS